MRIQLLWPNGQVTTGESWREVEDSARAAQWHPYKTRHEFRAEMRHRAEVWSGQPCKPSATRQTSRRFLEQLAEHGMFMIVVGDPDRVRARAEDEAAENSNSSDAQ